MLNYIQDLLPRLQTFSKSLDQTSIFIDKPWINIDPEGNQIQYIFQRTGNLIMSKKGKVTMGTWEYIGASNSLLINRGVDILLLNQVFIEKAILFLRPDGTTNDPWVLINKNEIPDLNAERYLQTLLKSNIGSKKIPHKYPDVIERHSYGSPKNVDALGYKIHEYPKTIISKRKRLFYSKTYRSPIENFTIKQASEVMISKGDCVFINNLPVLTDRTLEIQSNILYESVVIKNGVVHEIRYNVHVLGLLIFFAMVIIGSFII